MSDIQENNYGQIKSFIERSDYLLTMGVLSDNGLADCAGESSFDTGSVYYLNVIFKNDNNVMEWSGVVVSWRRASFYFKKEAIIIINCS